MSWQAQATSTPAWARACARFGGSARPASSSMSSAAVAALKKHGTGRHCQSKRMSAAESGSDSSWAAAASAAADSSAAAAGAGAAAAPPAGPPLAAAAAPAAAAGVLPGAAPAMRGGPARAAASSGPTARATWRARRGGSCASIAALSSAAVASHGMQRVAVPSGVRSTYAPRLPSVVVPTEAEAPTPARLLRSVTAISGTLPRPGKLTMKGPEPETAIWLSPTAPRRSAWRSEPSNLGVRERAPPAPGTGRTASCRARAQRCRPWPRSP
jgi:hypothetical protein